MRVYRFDADVARQIGDYGSVNLSLVRIAELGESAAIRCMYFGSGGMVGYHEAAIPQLFLVVQGEGWARGEKGKRIAIHTGQAAFWESGERHEAGSEDGMTAIILEGPGIDPGEWMQPVSG